MKTLPFVCTAVTAFGCYTYVPSAVDDIPLQAEVQATLSTAGEVGLRDRVGLQTGRLQGELVARSEDQLLIAIPTTGPFTSSTGERFYQRIDISRADVLSIAVKEQSTARTVALLVGAAGAATAVTIVTFSAERNPGDAPDGNPGPNEHRVLTLPTLLRIP